MYILSPQLLYLRLLRMFQSDIPLFTLTWPAKHSPNQRWQSTHRLHLYPLGGAFYYVPSIEHQVGGTSISQLIRRTQRYAMAVRTPHSRIANLAYVSAFSWLAGSDGDGGGGVVCVCVCGGGGGGGGGVVHNGSATLDIINIWSRTTIQA